MAISLEDQSRPALSPVVKRTRIGEKFVGAIVKVEPRDQTKKDKDGVRRPVLKPGTSKARQELVVTCVTMPKSTGYVGIGDDTHEAREGEVVRLILKGRAYGDWIEQRKTHRDGKLSVGDVVVQEVTHAQAYDADGEKKGGEITTQAAADALPRSTSIGYYGPLTLHEPEDHTWVQAAEDAYHAATAIQAAPDIDDESPF